MNKYTVELKTGMSYAKPVINKFSSGFDTLELLLDNDSTYTDCTFAVVYSVYGETGMDIENGGKLTKTTDEQTITLTWALGTQVSTDSGIVIYQVVAYRTSENGEVSAVWYSPQGRIAVGDSVDTTEYEAMQIGAQPSVVAQLIAAVGNADKTSREAAQTGKTNSADILNLQMRSTVLETQTAELEAKASQLYDGVNEAKSDIRKIETEVELGFENLGKQAGHVSDAVEQLNLKAAEAQQSIADINAEVGS